MRRLLLFLFIVMHFSSCVTLLNKDYVTFKVNVDSKAEVTYHKKYDNAEYNIHSLPESESNNRRKEIQLVAKRSQHNALPLSIKEDGVERTIHIKPVHSNVYYYNLYPSYGAGMIVDCNNENRFTYPKLVYINFNDTAGRGYITHKPFTNHQWEITIKTPLTNLFITKFNYVNASANPFGLEAGLNYHYSPKSFLSVELGACFGKKLLPRFRWYTDSNVYYYNHALDSKTNVYLNIAHNHVLGRFDFGYGINAAIHNAIVYYYGYRQGDLVIYQASYFSLGGAFSTHYKITDNIFTGISYMPQFMQIGGNTKVIYEHVWNFGLSLRMGYGKKWPDS